MKTLFGTIAGVILGLTIGGLIFLEYETSLEIYTLENIYYIDGLDVTNENDAYKYTFDNVEELKAYISDKTANDNQEGYNCLMREEVYSK